MLLEESEAERRRGECRGRVRGWGGHTAADGGLSFSNCFCLGFLPSLLTMPNQALISPSPTLIIHDVTSAYFLFVFLDFFSFFLLLPVYCHRRPYCWLNISRWCNGEGEVTIALRTFYPYLSVYCLSPHLLQF